MILGHLTASIGARLFVRHVDDQFKVVFLRSLGEDGSAFDHTYSHRTAEVGAPDATRRKTDIA